MIEEVGFAGLDKRQLVSNARRMRQQIAEPCSALAVLAKATFRSQQICSMAAGHKGETFSFEIALWHRFAVELIQHRLMVEHVKL